MPDAVSMATRTEEPSFADVLIVWREEHHLGIQDAARRVGVQPRTWTSWESGSAPQLSAISGLALTLGLRCADLLALLPDLLGEPASCGSEVAAAIRGWRRRDALSLARAARRLDVSPSTVLDWEAGRQPRAVQLSKLMAAGVVSS